jgi:DNA-binding NtrC family response regulator
MNKRLLLLDDDPDDNLLFKMAMEEAEPGWDIIIAETPAQFECMQINNPKPDLILLDISFQKMFGSGLQFIRNKKPLYLVPIVVTSTYASPLTVKRCLDDGAVAFFQKPSDFNETKQMAHAILNYCKMRA